MTSQTDHMTRPMQLDGLYVIGVISSLKPMPHKDTGEIWGWQVTIRTTAGTTRILAVAQERTMRGPVGLPAYASLSETARVGERWAISVGVTHSKDGKYTNYTAITADPMDN